MADTEKKYSNIDLSKYANGFQGSNSLNQAGLNKQSAENAYKAFADKGFSSEKIGLADEVLNKYMNRDPFSYDFNADALYQQYKDKYIQQGKMAMQDTMGQAAAMTGGYGNSYAATVGNQAYQAQLNNLNDIIPELYQLAYDKYNQDGQNMLNQYSMLGDAIDREYGMWGDKLNMLMADRDYYGQEESNLYNREYGAWNDNRNYDTTQYWNETNFGYGKEQDAIANDLKAREMAIAEAKEAREKQSWELQLEDLGYVYDPVTGKFQKKEEDDDDDEDDEIPPPAPVASAGKVIDAMVKTGTVDTGKTVDKGTVAGQKAMTSAINKEINNAVKAGELTPAEAAELKKKYNPRGYTK